MSFIEEVRKTTEEHKHDREKRNAETAKNIYEQSVKSTILREAQFGGNSVEIQLSSKLLIRDFMISSETVFAKVARLLRQDGFTVSGEDAVYFTLNVRW